MKQQPVPIDQAQTDHIDLDQADAYGRSFADVYDRWYDGVSDARATAAFVAARCDDATIVEIGVGSGRLATPLADLGCTVVGLDASVTMLRQVQRDGAVHLVMADMRALPFRNPVGAVLIAFNTLFNLASEDDQAAMLAAIAPLLTADGRLIIEALDVTPLLGGPSDSIGVRSRDDDGVVVTATQLDQDSQIMIGQHLEITSAQISIRPWRLRWLTPQQLDRLSEAAGLELVDRFGSWCEDPFTEESDTHISVYRRRRY